MSQNKLKTILFDLDGTLVDTAPEMYMALNILLDEEKIDKKPFKVIRPQISNGVKGIFSIALNGMPDTDNRMFSEERIMHYFNFFVTCVMSSLCYTQKDRRHETYYLYPIEGATKIDLKSRYDPILR